MAHSGLAKGLGKKRAADALLTTTTSTRTASAVVSTAKPGGPVRTRRSRGRSGSSAPTVAASGRPGAPAVPVAKRTKLDTSTSAPPRIPGEGVWVHDSIGRKTFTMASDLRLSTVGVAYRRQCASAVIDLDTWAVESGHYDVLEADPDAAMEIYFDTLSGDSVGPQLGAVTLYGYILLRTSLNARDGSIFQKSRVALRGWRRKMPGGSRDPVDLDLIWLIATDLLDAGELDAATALAFQADGYLRPSEAIGLSGNSVVWASAGQVARGALDDKVALVIAPSEEGVPAKTGQWDETILVGEFGNRSWMRDVAKGAWRPERLFPHLTLERYERSFRRIVKKRKIVDLGITPHVVRHSAPSTDLLLGAITLPELKKRGRWASDRSVVRYGKAGRLLVAMRQVPPELAADAASAALEFPGRLLAALRSLA